MGVEASYQSMGVVASEVLLHLRVATEAKNTSYQLSVLAGREAYRLPTEMGIGLLLRQLKQSELFGMVSLHACLVEVVR